MASPSSTASPASAHQFAPGARPAADEADGVVWRIEHDVLGRGPRWSPATGDRTRGSTGRGSPTSTRPARRVDRRTRPRPGRKARRVRDPLAGGDVPHRGTCRSAPTSSTFHVAIELVVTEDGAEFARRHWAATLPRSSERSRPMGVLAGPDRSAQNHPIGSAGSDARQGVAGGEVAGAVVDQLDVDAGAAIADAECGGLAGQQQRAARVEPAAGRDRAAGRGSRR